MCARHLSASRTPERSRVLPRLARSPPQMPKISMVWLTSEKPCSRATSAAHVSTWPPCTSTVRAAQPGTPGGGDGAPSSAGTPTRRCRCATCRPGRPPPSTAGCGTRWSGRCPRRGGAVRRAAPGPTGSRRGSPAAPRSPRAAGWRARRAAVLTRCPPRRGSPRRRRCRPGGGRRAGRCTSRPDRSPATTPAALRMRRCWLTSGCGTAERVDEFVHAARRLAQLQHDRDPHRRGQRAQQVAGGVEDLARRQIRQRGVAVLVVVPSTSSRQRRRVVETVFIMSATIHARSRMSTAHVSLVAAKCGNAAANASLRC